MTVLRCRIHDSPLLWDDPMCDSGLTQADFDQKVTCEVEEIVKVVPHEFHLLDPQQAYCVCGWLSEIPKGWWSVTLGDLSEQWQAHVE